jgi:hypothetical protein
MIAGIGRDGGGKCLVAACVCSCCGDAGRAVDTCDVELIDEGVFSRLEPDSSDEIAEISDCDQDDRSASSLYNDKRGGSAVKRFKRRLRWVDVCWLWLWEGNALTMSNQS